MLFLYLALAVVAGLVAGFNVGGIPISSVIVVGLIGSAIVVRHRHLKGLPARRLQLAWLAIYLILAVPLAVTLGNPPF